MTSTALVIQCFVKADTLKDTCESLLSCNLIGNLDLIFWSDSAIGSRDEGRYLPLAAEVAKYLDGFCQQWGSRFKSVTRRVNTVNHGTCKTCELALDYAFSLHPFVIFVEDDVIFATDAIAWFEEMRRRSVLSDERNWAIAGESIFFNARDEPIPDGWPAAMRQLAIDERLNSAYIANKFVPSTCFATTREKWHEFGHTRGQPLGDGDVCERCQKEDRYTIFPVVARVKDVGMLHDNGYSVSIHSKSGVSEVKNTYLMSDDLVGPNQPGMQEMRLFDGSAGRIFTLSTLLRQA
jgi:hypothetical protein